MRGLYTIGVLDLLMEEAIRPDYVIGVSAGACNGVSFVSGQRGRAYRINMDYLGDSRYLSVANMLREKSMFGMDFLFEEIPDKLDPFDYDGFHESPMEFVTGVTDVKTGEPVYFTKEDIGRSAVILRASSSIPVFSPVVEFRGGKYLDGGTTDPIPVRKALADGCDQVIVVLTRDWTYIKQPEQFRLAYRRVFRNAPGMIRALDRRDWVYNDSREFVRELEQAGKAVVIAPSSPIRAGRFEKDRAVLDEIWTMGRQDCREKLEQIRNWVCKKTPTARIS